ncbi:hypothetical protein OAK17_05845 [Alphaproteobacteria bacterium]|nr:hypothetical protein [Alphaproteobacteria bacterium]
MDKKVFFYVQHLLGIGHLKRASILSNELQRNNFEVYLISGGMPVPNLILNNVKLIQLPSIKVINGDFNQIVDKNNILVDEKFFLKRSDALSKLFIEINPDILIIEMYPFGRKSIELELENLLIQVKNINKNIFVLSSVRDILIKKKKISRYKEMLTKFNKYFDYVLVHSDEKIISFDDTFPFTNKIQTQLFHTGYVVDNLKRSNFKKRKKEIIVSAGGGAVGKKILKTAILSREKTIIKDYKWRILIGTNESEETITELKDLVNKNQGNIIIEKAHPNLRDLLVRSELSISQGGYNTMLDIVSSEIKAVVIPFNEKNDSDQSLRASLFKKYFNIEVLDEKNLNSDNLASIINISYLSKKKNKHHINLYGAKNTVSFINKLYDL